MWTTKLPSQVVLSIVLSGYGLVMSGYQADTYPEHLWINKKKGDKNSEQNVILFYKNKIILNEV